MDRLERAIEEAVSEVMRKAQIRPILLTALLTFLVTLAIILPVVLVEASSVSSQAKRDAQVINVNTQRNQEANCNLIKTLVYIEANFIKSDTVDKKGALTTTERQQILSGFSKLFNPKLITTLTKKQNALDNQTILYWTYTLEPLAVSLEKANCKVG